MPRPAHPEQRRAEVVEGAFRLLARDGVEGFSMRAVAQEAGCTIGLINHWFASKDDVIDAAVERAIDDALARSRAALDNGTAVEDGLSQFLPLDETRVAELRIWLAFWAMSISRPDLNERHNARAAELRKLLKKDATSVGLPSDRIAKAVDVLMPLVDGITVNALLDPDYWTPSRQLKALRTALDALQIH